MNRIIMFLIMTTSTTTMASTADASALNMQQLGIGGIFSLMVLNVVFGFLKAIAKYRKNGDENESKVNSRDKIAETARGVASIANDLKNREDAFFHMKNKIDSMDEIIGAVNEKRVPLIFNPGLEKSIDLLANNVEIQSRNTALQTGAIKDLIGNCKKQGN